MLPQPRVHPAVPHLGLLSCLQDHLASPQPGAGLPPPAQRRSEPVLAPVQSREDPAPAWGLCIPPAAGDERGASGSREGAARGRPQPLQGLKLPAAHGGMSRKLVSPPSGFCRGNFKAAGVDHLGVLSPCGAAKFPIALVPQPLPWPPARAPVTLAIPCSLERRSRLPPACLCLLPRSRCPGEGCCTAKESPTSWGRGCQ